MSFVMANALLTVNNILLNKSFITFEKSGCLFKKPISGLYKEFNYMTPIIKTRTFLFIKPINEAGHRGRSVVVTQYDVTLILVNEDALN